MSTLEIRIYGAVLHYLRNLIHVSTHDSRSRSSVEQPWPVTSHPSKSGTFMWNIYPIDYFFLRNLKVCLLLLLCGLFPRRYHRLVNSNVCQQAFFAFSFQLHCFRGMRLLIPNRLFPLSPFKFQFFLVVRLLIPPILRISEVHVSIFGRLVLRCSAVRYKCCGRSW